MGSIQRVAPPAGRMDGWMGGWVMAKEVRYLETPTQLAPRVPILFLTAAAAAAAVDVTTTIIVTKLWPIVPFHQAQDHHSLSQSYLSRPLLFQIEPVWMLRMQLVQS